MIYGRLSEIIAHFYEKIRPSNNHFIAIQQTDLLSKVAVSIGHNTISKSYDASQSTAFNIYFAVALHKKNRRKWFVFGVFFRSFSLPTTHFLLQHNNYYCCLPTVIYRLFVWTDKCVTKQFYRSNRSDMCGFPPEQFLLPSITFRFVSFWKKNKQINTFFFFQKVLFIAILFW